MCNSFGSYTTDVLNERVKCSYLVTRVSLAAWWSNSPQLALEIAFKRKKKEKEKLQVSKQKI